MGKNIVISCGPIPARLDSVKFITNRFKGGLAFKTASYLIGRGHKVTVIAWKFTPIPDDIQKDAVQVVLVDDVFDYYAWFEAHATEYEAFIMAAAVANLTPVSPYEGKFPSHNYKVGEEFDIRFMIAPRAIDIVKKLNSRACLIGYKLFDAQTDEELVEIARHTRADAKANIIFANTPKEAKTRKLAIMADNSVVPCSFDEHLELMDRVINAQWFKTVVEDVDENIMAAPEVRCAMALVTCFEKSFNDFGTVAVPVGDYGFVTTARGHKAGPVLVRKIDYENRIVYASGKATLNAPTMAAFVEPGHIVIHRHFADADDQKQRTMRSGVYTAARYMFPGTLDEAVVAQQAAMCRFADMVLPWHGYISVKPVSPVDWKKYYEIFPEKYFTTPDAFRKVLAQYEGMKTLEVGGNVNATGRYAYDPFAAAAHAENITWEEVKKDRFDLVFARNAVNYLTRDEIETLLQRTDHFIANTFLVPPEEKVTDIEAAVRHEDKILHYLRLPDDIVLAHRFFAYDEGFWNSLGLTVTPYGKNSALISRGLGF